MMMSRKVESSFTGSRLLAFWSPMLVPSPPLSLMTTVLESRSGSKRVESDERVSKSGRSSTGSILSSGIMPVSLLMSDW